MITITVNGTPETIAAGTTVRQLLAARNLSPDKVAVELNRRLLRSDRYDAELQPSDALEIVTFVGGG
jgi:sulfur carrier protein